MYDDASNVASCFYIRFYSVVLDIITPGRDSKLHYETEVINLFYPSSFNLLLNTKIFPLWNTEETCQWVDLLWLITPNTYNHHGEAMFNSWPMQLSKCLFVTIPAVVT